MLVLELIHYHQDYLLGVFYKYVMNLLAHQLSNQITIKYYIHYDSIAEPPQMQLVYMVGRRNDINNARQGFDGMIVYVASEKSVYVSIKI